MLNMVNNVIAGLRIMNFLVYIIPNTEDKQDKKELNQNYFF